MNKHRKFFIVNWNYFVELSGISKIHVSWISILCSQLLKVVCLEAIVPTFWNCLLSNFRTFLLTPNFLPHLLLSNTILTQFSKLNLFLFSLLYFVFFQHFQYSSLFHLIYSHLLLLDSKLATLLFPIEFQVFIEI